MVEYTLDSALNALETLRDRAIEIIEKNHGSPLPGSQAEQELSTPITSVSGDVLPTAEKLATIFSQATILTVSAADHLMALKRTLTDPVLSIACWTPLRVVIEHSALACWLLDPQDTASSRIRKSFAMRYEDINQQKAFANSQHNMVAEAQKTTNRIEKIEREALTFGYPHVVDKNKKRIGVGIERPKLTTLVKEILDQEVQYRISSGVIHGSQSVINQLSFQRKGEEAAQYGSANLSVYEQTMSFETFAGICISAALSFSRANFLLCQLYGWDKNETVDFLSNTANVLRISRAKRFWEPKP